MSSTKEQVLTFLDKCEELKSCKFIMATTKIKDLLKCIVNCPELYRLFEAVTRDFDYPAAKPKCLVTVEDGLYNRSYISLPQTVGQRLAFIFCLLVEFDKDTINFNDFLRKYFPEDGSYFASYQAFCNIIIKALQDAITQVFKDVLSAPEDMEAAPQISPNSYKAELLSALGLAINEEIETLKQSKVPEEDKIGGIKILTELFGAIKNDNYQLIDALVCGYNYFVLYHKFVSDGVAALIQGIAAYKQL